MHSEIEALMTRLTKVQSLHSRWGNRSKKLASKVEARASEAINDEERKRLLNKSLSHLISSDNDLEMSAAIKDAKATIKYLHQRLREEKRNSRGLNKLTDAFAEVLK